MVAMVAVAMEVLARVVEAMVVVDTVVVVVVMTMVVVAMVEMAMVVEGTLLQAGAPLLGDAGGLDGEGGAQVHHLLPVPGQIRIGRDRSGLERPG